MLENKSICFITNAYPDFITSGRGMFIKKMALLLKESGYQIVIITPKIYKKSLYSEEQERIEIYRFPFFSGNKPLIEYKNIPYLKMFIYYATGFLLTSYIIFKHKCHLIHAHWAIPTGLIGVLVGKLLKIPMILTIHGSDFRITKMKLSILKKIFIYVCKRSKHIICVSDVLKREIEKLGIKGEKVSVSPMGVDEIFVSSQIKNEIRIEKWTKIVSNRQLQPVYNLSLLIRAIPVVLKDEPDTKFYIAGIGPERGNLEKQVKDLNINSSVHFLGWVAHEEMPKLLSQADLYVSTSLDDGTSISLLEAMASGCFPIVSDIPSNREWIRDGENGFLFPVNDENILAQKILMAIRNKSLREKSREENLRIIKEKALWSVCIEKIKGIYEAQLSRSKA